MRFCKKICSVLLVISILLPFLVLPAAAGVTERYTMKVGETKTIYIETKGKAAENVRWYSNSSAVRVLSYNSYSCTVEAVQSTSTPVIVRCDYNYWDYRGMYSYLLSDYFDAQITVNGGNSGGGLPSNSKYGYTSFDCSGVYIDIAKDRYSYVNVYVSGLSSDTYHFEWGYSDTNGHFRINKEKENGNNLLLRLYGYDVGKGDLEVCLYDVNGYVRDIATLDVEIVCSHIWNTGKVTKEPTEETEGEKRFVCTVCEETKTEAIAKLPHEHQYTEEVTAPTCTKGGYTTFTCKCGESYTDKETKESGHRWDEGKVTKEPTEETEGEKHFVCTVCEETKTEAIAKLPHEHQYTEEITAPTCTKDGYTTFTCKCGESYVDAYEKCKGHGFVDGICMVCGEKDPDYVEPTPVVTPKPTVEPTPTPTPTPVPTPEPTPEQPKNPFTDVKESDWFYNPVMWAVAANVTGGTSPTTFSPENPCTRGQVVTFLWAANGRPEPKLTVNPFEDVSESDWYYKPVLWAVENGITGGVAKGLFGPEQDCTRAQIVTFLYAAENRPFIHSYDNGFADVKESDWFYEPVMWAAENEVTGGIGDGMFGPNNVCTRGQIVTFLFKVHG